MSAPEHHPLDDLAKGVARGTISRRRALKLISSAVGGATLALIPGIASASPPSHSNAGGRFGSSAPPEHAQDHTGFGAGGRFGKGGPPPGSGTCPAKECDSDADCGSGCACSCFLQEQGVFVCCSA